MHNLSAEHLISIQTWWILRTRSVICLVANAPRIDIHTVPFGTFPISVFTSTMSGLPFYIYIYIYTHTHTHTHTHTSICMVLKLGHLWQWMTNTWKVLHCGVGEGWRKSVGPIVW